MRLTILLPSLFILLFLISACKAEEKEPTVEPGKTITFDYAAGFDNGTLFDTSFETVAKESGIYDPNRIYRPVKMVYGKNPLFPGLEEALLGMKAGDIKNIRIPPDKAYGTKIKNSITVLAKETFTNYENLKVDDVVTLVTPKGNTIKTYIKKMGEENITVDLNHPLAGHYVQFAIILRSIE